MDGYLIVEFDTAEEAQSALDVINQIAAAWWQSQGYTVINGELVGKNAKSGLDDPRAAKTKTWDNIKLGDNGKYYFSSLSNNPMFVDWRAYLPDGIIIPTDTELQT